MMVVMTRVLHVRLLALMLPGLWGCKRQAIILQNDVLLGMKKLQPIADELLLSSSLPGNL